MVEQASDGNTIVLLYMIDADIEGLHIYRPRHFQDSSEKQGITMMPFPKNIVML